MYELPEYREGQTYWICAIQDDSVFTTAIINEAWGYKFYSKQNNIFATRELAKIEADRRNAYNKLRNLAREREKEFPIEQIEEKEEQEYNLYYFMFFTDFIAVAFRADKLVIPQAIYVRFRGSNEAETWLRAVMSESEIKALCMPVRYV